MRTNIGIDDELMARVLVKTGPKSKRAALEEGLRLLLREVSQKAAVKYFGKIPWESNLDEMRRN